MLALPDAEDRILRFCNSCLWRNGHNKFNGNSMQIV